MASERHGLHIYIDSRGAAAGAAAFRGSVGQIEGATRRVEASQVRARTAFNRTGSTLLRVRALLLGLGIGFTMAAIVQEIATFEQAMADVAALLGSERGPAHVMEQMNQVARELGATTVFTAREAAEGFKYLTLAGFDAQESIEALPATLNLASAGALSLGRAADLATNILTAFRLEADQTADVVDVMAATASRSNTSINQLGEAMKFVAPAAAAAGNTVRQTSAALGILGNSGIQATLAGTALRNIMIRITNPSDKAREALGQLGLTFETLQAELQGERGLIGVINLLADAGLDLGTALKIGQARAGGALLALTNSVDDLNEMEETLRNVEGAAQDMADIRMDTIIGALTRLRSALSEASLQVGDSGFGGGLRRLGEYLAGVVTELNGMTEIVGRSHESFLNGVQAVDKYRNAAETVSTAVNVLLGLLGVKLVVAMAKATAGFFGLRSGTLASNATLLATNVAALRAATGLGIVTAAARVAGTAFSLAFGPAGVVILAVATLASFIGSVRDTSHELRQLDEDLSVTLDKFREMGEASQTLLLGRLEDQFASLGKQIERLEAAQSLLDGGFQGNAQEAAQVRRELKALGLEALDNATITKILRGDTDALSHVMLVLQSELDNTKGEYGELFARLNQLRAEHQGLGVDMANVTTEAEKEKRALEELADSTGLTFEQFVALEDELNGVLRELDPSIAALEKYNAQMKVLEDALKATRENGAEPFGLTAQEIEVRMRQLTDEFNGASEAVEELGDVFLGSAENGEMFVELMEGLAKAHKENFNAAEELRRKYLEGHAASEDYAAITAEVTRLIKGKHLTEEEGLAIMKSVTEEFNSQDSAAKGFAVTLNTVLKQTFRQVHDAFSDFIYSGLNGFKEFRKEALSTEEVFNLLKSDSEEVAAKFKELTDGGYSVTDALRELQAQGLITADAFEEMTDRGLSATEAFTKAVVDLFKKMVSDIAALLVTNSFQNLFAKFLPGIAGGLGITGGQFGLGSAIQSLFGGGAAGAANRAAIAGGGLVTAGFNPAGLIPVSGGSAVATGGAVTGGGAGAVSSAGSAGGLGGLSALQVSGFVAAGAILIDALSNLRGNRTKSLDAVKLGFEDGRFTGRDTIYEEYKTGNPFKKDERKRYDVDRDVSALQDAYDSVDARLTRLAGELGFVRQSGELPAYEQSVSRHVSTRDYESGKLGYRSAGAIDQDVADFGLERIEANIRSFIRSNVSELGDEFRALSNDFTLSGNEFLAAFDKLADAATMLKDSADGAARPLSDFEKEVATLKNAIADAADEDAAKELVDQLNSITTAMREGVLQRVEETLNPISEFEKKINELRDGINAATSDVEANELADQWIALVEAERALGKAREGALARVDEALNPLSDFERQVRDLRSAIETAATEGDAQDLATQLIAITEAERSRVQSLADAEEALNAVRSSALARVKEALDPLSEFERQIQTFKDTIDSTTSDALIDQVSTQWIAYVEAMREMDEAVQLLDQYRVDTSKIMDGLDDVFSTSPLERVAAEFQDAGMTALEVMTGQIVALGEMSAASDGSVESLSLVGGALRSMSEAAAQAIRDFTGIQESVKSTAQAIRDRIEEADLTEVQKFQREQRRLEDALSALDDPKLQEDAAALRLVSDQALSAANALTSSLLSGSQEFKAQLSLLSDAIDLDGITTAVATVETKVAEAAQSGIELVNKLTEDMGAIVRTDLQSAIDAQIAAGEAQVETAKQAAQAAVDAAQAAKDAATAANDAATAATAHQAAADTQVGAANTMSSAAASFPTTINVNVRTTDSREIAG